MKNITLKYGSSIHTMTVSQNTNIGQALMDGTAKVILGYGDNVHGLIGGVAQTNDTIIPDGATVEIENKANSKAV
jgi:hypothetical protein